MKIMVAVDGSRSTPETLQYLSRFPFAVPPLVTLAHVCPVPDLHRLGTGVAPDVHKLVDEARSKGADLLRQSEAESRTWSESVDTKLLAGHAAHEIIKCADEIKAELVVVGARGMGNIQRFLLGSVSDQIIKHAPCSVLVIRPDQNPASDLVAHEILIADDGSPSAANAVERFSTFPLTESRRVSVLGVLETFEHFGIQYQAESGGDWDRQGNLLREHVEHSREKLLRATPSVQAIAHHAHNAADDILQVAEKSHADLIVIGSRGKQGWERVLLGSVSTRVVHHATCSVWVERTQH